MKSRILLYCCVCSLNILACNAQNANYEKIGVASFYADKFEGRTTANGEIYYHAKKTAAHRSLPFGTIVKVTNLDNNKYVVVRINDRGPFIDNRIIDLSKSAAKEIDFLDKGLAKVRIEVIANTNDLPDKIAEIRIKEKQDIKTYYQIESKLVKPKGKGIQVGSYSDNENLIKIIADLKIKYNETIFIEIATVNNQSLYRVIVASLHDKSELERLKRQLKNEFPDCFIVSFKN